VKKHFFLKMQNGNKKNRHLEVAAIIGLILTLPMYMLYQAATQQQIIDPIFGSYFSLAALLSLPFSLYVFLNRYGFANLFSIFTAKLFLLFVFLIILGAGFGWLSGVNKELVNYSLGSGFRLIALFFLVFCFDVLQKKQRHAFIFFLLLNSTHILFSSNGVSFIKPAFFVDEYLFEYDYQQIALISLILAIVFLPFMRFFARFFIYVILIPALFLIGARSEFYAFLLIIFIMEAFREKPIINLSWVVLFSICIFVIMFGTFDFGLSEHRIFSIFSGVGDSSLSARQELTLHAIDTISENILLGDYGYHPPGDYAHNGLAAWADYGLFGFLLLIMLLYIPLLSLLRLWRKRKCVEWLQAFSCISLTIFLLIFAKTYTYGLISISIALYCIFLLKMKRKELRYFSHIERI